MPRLAKVLTGLAVIACVAVDQHRPWRCPVEGVVDQARQHVNYPETQHLHYEYGPIDITPGQNNIEAHINNAKPKVPGYITRFKPNLVYSGTHKVPRVDVIHLHHGVWLNNGYPTFAAGRRRPPRSFRAATGTTTSPATAGS